MIINIWTGNGKPAHRRRFCSETENPNAGAMRTGHRTLFGYFHQSCRWCLRIDYRTPSFQHVNKQWRPIFLIFRKCVTTFGNFGVIDEHFSLIFTTESHWTLTIASTTNLGRGKSIWPLFSSIFHEANFLRVDGSKCISSCLFTILFRFTLTFCTKM